MNWKFYLKKYTWLIILLAVAISFLFSGLGTQIKFLLPYLLMVLMFLSCMNIEFGRAWKHLKKIRKIIISMMIIFLLSPIIIYLFRNWFSPEIFFGLILAASAPAGMSVVFLANLHGGSTAKSLVIMTLSNLLAPFLLPFLVLWLTNTKINVDVAAMIWNMVKLIVLPFVAAMILQKTVVKKMADEYGTYFSIIILFFLILGVVSPVVSVVLANFDQSLWLFGLIVILVLINFVVSCYIGSDQKAKITYAISNSYKNFTLTTVLALTLFNPVVALPSVLYTIANNVLLVPLQWWVGERK